MYCKRIPMTTICSSNHIAVVGSFITENSFNRDCNCSSSFQRRHPLQSGTIYLLQSRHQYHYPFLSSAKSSVKSLVNHDDSPAPASVSESSQTLNYATAINMNIDLHTFAMTVPFFSKLATEALKLTPSCTGSQHTQQTSARYIHIYIYISVVGKPHLEFYIRNRQQH